MPLVRSITLSTGKTISIAAYGGLNDGSIHQTTLGALYIDKVRNGVQTIVYNPYTKAEMREFRYLITGVDNDNFTWPPAVSQGTTNTNRVVPIACVQFGSTTTIDDPWEFRAPIVRSGNREFYVKSYGTPNTNNGIFIDNESYDGSGPPHTTGNYTWFNYMSILGKFQVFKFTGNLANGTYYPFFQDSSYTIPNMDAMMERAESLPGTGGISIDDDGNPYGGGGTSVFGGGDGDYDGAGIEDKDVTPIPDVPTLSATGAGFIKLYNPSKAQLTSLASFLWSSAFDVDSFKKLFADPMEAMIGLGIVPVNPNIGGSSTVKFGDVDSGVSMPVINNQFVQKSMGTVSIKKYVGCFMDYAPYTNIQIYLPYIGVRELSPDDVMNDTVTVTYNIDVLSGACAAIVSTGGEGVIYQYNGSCIANVPLTSINYSGAIQNAVSALGSVATTVVGAATGAAPVAAMGIMGLATSAANTAVNSKPTIQRSGAMGGAAGLLSVQKPYLIISRPNLSVPDKLNTFSGNTCNVTMKLSACKGFTMVDSIHLNGIPCTDDERAELLTLLQQGVIF